MTRLNHASFRLLTVRQTKFLWIRKDADFAPHLLVCLVLQVEDAEKFLLALGFESLDPFFQSASWVHVSQA